MPDPQDIVDLLNGLSPEEQIFVSAYSNTLNLTEAYLQVSPNVKRESAGLLGLRMYRRPSVRLAIQEYIAARKEAYDLDGKMVLHTLLQIAAADISEFMDDEGAIDLKKVKDAPKELRMAVEMVERSVSAKGEEKNKIKMESKLKAMELLGKYLKLWTDKMELGGADGGPLTVKHEYVGEDVEPKKEA